MFDIKEILGFTAYLQAYAQLLPLERILENDLELLQGCSGSVR